MSITPKEPADFSPSIGTVTPLKPFRYWCQKVLPLVYDDSLSYYELLCKVVDYLNKTMEDVNTLSTHIENLSSAFDNLQNYVNDYFSTLDVQEEINNKLDQMAEDGSLSALIQPLFDTYKGEIDEEMRVFKIEMNGEMTGYKLQVNNEISTFKNEVGDNIDNQDDRITVLEGRMNSFSSLPDGSLSTAADAELVDIRVADNGVIYATAGDAVRQQASDLEDDIDEIVDTNILLRYRNTTFTRPQETWQYYSKTIAIPSGTEIISINCDSVTYDGTALTGNYFGVLFKNGTTPVGNTLYCNVMPCIETIAVPDGVDNAEIRIYVNTTGTANTSVTVNNFYVVATSGGDIEISLRENIKTNFISSNALIYYPNKTFYTPKATWHYGVKYVALPAGTKKLGIFIGGVSYDDTPLALNYVLIRELNDAGTQLASAYCNVINSVDTLNVVEGTTKLEVRFYTNTSSANNTSVTVTDFWIVTDAVIRKLMIDDNLYIGDMRVGELADITTSSKNLFTSEFNKGSINGTTGVYSDNPNIITNTATKQPIPIKSNTSYTLSWKWNEYYITLGVFQYDANGDFINYLYDSWTKRTNAFTFTTHADAKFIRIQFYSNTSESYSDIAPKDVQLEYGGIETPCMATFDISDGVDYEKVRNNSLILPDYYFASGYISNKSDTIRQLMFDANGNYDSFIFITDTHWERNQQKSPALIRYLTRSLHINRIFHGGDFYDQWSQYFHNDCMRELESAYDGAIYSVPGNHEYKGNYMDDGEIWYFLNSMHDNIVIGDSARNYYYVDNIAQKMRYICLNVYKSNGSNDAEPYFDSEQAAWLQNIALNVDSGWSIIVFVHTLLEINLATRGIFDIEGVTTTVESILDNYNGNGEIICVVQGHLHNDRITSTPGGIPIIVTACDKNGVWYDENDNPDITVVRDNGTISENAFDVYVINKNIRKISVVRIGAIAYDGIGNNVGSPVEIREVNY